MLKNSIAVKKVQSCPMKNVHIKKVVKSKVAAKKWL